VASGSAVLTVGREPDKTTGNQSKDNSRARATAWVRFSAASFSRRLPTCFLTVVRETTMWSAISPRRILSGSALLIGVGFTIYSFQSWYVAGLIICFLMSLPQGGIPVAFGPLLLGATPKEMMGRVQAVVDTGMSGVSLISVALAGFLGQFLPVGVILTGCGLLIALAGLFGWFAIQEKAPARPEVRSQFS
jgi:predicted MFS family arabinose efflux permease